MRTFSLILTSLVFYTCQPPLSAPESAELWQNGVVSTASPEFASSINSEQNQMYFNRTSDDRSVMRIMESEWVDSDWMIPKALPFSTGEFIDVDPFLTLDGSRLYFTSTRPGGFDGNWDTWYVEKTEDGWSEPINPGAPLNTDSTEIFITIATNGNAYYVTDRDGDRGIVVSRFQDGQYREPEKIRPTLRGEPIYASNPAIASDESFLIVALRDPEGNQTPDLFVTWNDNGEWSAFQNLGPKVNHPSYADFAPGLSKDNKILFFTSERPGVVGEQPDGVRPPGDIYWVDLEAVFADLR